MGGKKVREHNNTGSQEAASVCINTNGSSAKAVKNKAKQVVLSQRHIAMVTRLIEYTLGFHFA